MNNKSKKNAWVKYDDEKVKEIFSFSDKYKSFISTCKTERECVKESIRLAESVGYRNLEDIIKNNETLKWNVLSLSKAVLKDDIFIDYSGKIYINDSDEKAVTELTTRKTISYEGEFVQIYSEGIIYKSENKLIKIQLEPKKTSEHNEKIS